MESIYLYSVSLTAELSLEHHGKENFVIYACDKNVHT